LYTPLVSICIPTFQRADRLKETLESILSQTMEDYEIESSSLTTAHLIIPKRWFARFKTPEFVFFAMNVISVQR
jgi:hypothetical protein